MNKKNKRVIRWWWSWNAEKIARWLEEMAAAGWILEGTGFAMMVFYFHQEAPRRTSYCADFQSRDIKAYKAFIGDSGWKLVAETAGWYLWARDYEKGAAKPRFFSDIDSLVSRNNRILLILAVILTPQFAVYQNILRRLAVSPSPFMVGLSIVYLLMMGFLGYAVVRTLRENRRLKKRQDNY